MTSSVAITGAHAVTALDDAVVASLPPAVRARALRAERITGLALAAVQTALARARLAEGPAPRARMGIVLGTAFGCFLTNAAYQERFAAGGPAAASPRLFAATVSNAAAGELGIAYGLAGPGVTLTAGSASGLIALGHATEIIRAGQADAVVAGGVDALGDSLTRWLGHGLATGRPGAEAAALLVLESSEHAEARGVGRLGSVLGHGAGFEPDPAAPDAGTGLAAAVRHALDDAQIPAGDVALVVSAAPPALGGLEARALAAVLGDVRPRCLVPRDLHGESFGAAGPLGLLAALSEAAPGAAVLVLDVCASGHVAALVARAGAEA
jgi:3-oxoacyl-(acyl-carrier-protein) synthase